MHSLSSILIRWLLSPAVFQWLSVFRNTSLNFAKDETPSQSSKVGRKPPSHPVTEIRPLHWEMTRHECFWMMKQWSTQSFDTGRKTADWFLSKGTGTATAVPRLVEVYFSEKTLTVTDSDWLCQYQLERCVYHLPPALLTIRHLLSTQLNLTQTTDCNRHISLESIQ